MEAEALQTFGIWAGRGGAKWQMEAKKAMELGLGA